MTLKDFIDGNMNTLLSEWEAFARSCVPAAGAMDGAALRGGAEAILLAVAADMQSIRSEEQRAAKSGSEPLYNAPAVTETAKQHAMARLSAGFTLGQLVSEYRVLRASVIRHWSATRPTDPEMLDELRFNEALDQSLTDAITWLDDDLERSRNFFLSVLGHDLRDPLNAALVTAELQLLTNDLAAHHRQSELIIKSLRRTGEMIEELLDFTRTRLGGRLPIWPQPADLKEACSEIVEAYSSSHRNRDVRVEYNGNLTGTWDVGRIKQLLSNLIRNALEHGSPGSPITLVATGEADEVSLAVRSEGQPLSTAEQSQIFEPRVHRETAGQKGRRASAGLGIGLYITKQIAEAHGGRVELRSTASDGTTFTARLPRTVVDHSGGRRP